MSAGGIFFCGMLFGIGLGAVLMAILFTPQKNDSGNAQ